MTNPFQRLPHDTKILAERETAKIEATILEEAEKIDAQIKQSFQTLLLTHRYPPVSSYVFLAAVLDMVMKWYVTTANTTHDLMIDNVGNASDEQRLVGLISLSTGAQAFAESICPFHSIAHQHVVELQEALEKMGGTGVKEEIVQAINAGQHPKKCTVH